MGLNYYANGTSNCHTHVFVPSKQRWVFIWVAKQVIRILHGNDTIDRVGINIFDEAVNEFGPFEQSMTALIRLCHYHRFNQKTSAFKSLAKTDYEKQIYDDFVIMCDFISENSETKLEFDFVINLIESHVENCMSKLNSALVDSFRAQLAAITHNEKRVANYVFFALRNLHKKTTGSNEVRHKNYKCGGDRVQPNHSLAKSADVMNKKRKTSIEKRKQTEASKITASHLWVQGFDGIEKFALQLIKGEWDKINEHASVRVSQEKWLVMSVAHRKSHGPKPNVKRVRVVTLIDGKLLACSYDLYLQIGIACTHMLKLMNEITEECFFIANWKCYNFHYLREDSSDELNKMFEEAAFTNPSPGVMMKNVTTETHYPSFCCKKVPFSEFEAILHAKWPVVDDWPLDTLKEAARKTIMNSDAPLGMHHEFSQNIEMEMLGDCLENQSSEADNLPLSTGNENSKSKQTLFESFKVCGDFVSKHEKVCLRL